MKGTYKGPKYPTNATGKIPAFKNYEEEANFWDTHSFTEFEDELEDVDIVFELDKPREEALVLRVQKNLKKAIEKIARRNALNPSALMRMWLTEKVNEALSGKNKGTSLAA
ncbi:MAG: CopG family antitoxin [Patescibacteria group bacterium]